VVLLLLPTLVLIPAILGGPQYSGTYTSTDLDMDTIEDIFGDTMRSGYGAEEEEGEWVTVPVNLVPAMDGSDDCSPMAAPTRDPKMMANFDEYKAIEVVKASGSNKCDFYTATQGFECVPYYQCDDDGTIITDGGGLIDIRFGGEGPELAILDSTDLMCPGSLDVCCKSLDFSSELTQQSTGGDDYDYGSPVLAGEQASPVQDPYVEETTTTTTTTTTTEAPDDVVVVEAAPLVEPEPYSYTPRCGKRNEHGLGVQVGGYQDGQAQFGEWPHICAVLRKELVTSSDGGQGQQEQEQEQEILVFVAGASLIAPGVVMTGAHKVLDYTGNPGELVVRCGEWDTQTESEPLDHQDRSVATVVAHPEYNPRNLGNTIALLFLAEHFQLADHIDTVCLPRYQETFDSSSSCYVKGWGKPNFGPDSQYSVVLKEVSLPMVTDDQCLTWLRATRLGRRFRLDQSHVCAGGEEGRDACRGDGGGPLVCPMKEDPSRYVQVGVVAWGIGCGDAEVPGVYTAVAEQVCWIDWTMRCHLGEAYTLQGGPQCQDWLAAKQSHRVPGIRSSYRECAVTWPQAEPYSLQEQEQASALDLAGPGRKTKASTLPERIVSKTKAPPQTKAKAQAAPGY